MKAYSFLFFLTGLFLLNSSANSATDSKFDVTPDAELLAQIKDLPENTWMKLPPQKVIGDLDWLPANDPKRKYGPHGRSYCNHAYWAPERKRALFCGGGHNTNWINDVWEYDLAGNTWICLKGSDPGSAYTEEWIRKNAKMLSNGVIAHKSGGFIWY